MGRRTSARQARHRLDAIRRIRKAGKASGILIGVEADARHWLELGCQFVAVGSDAVILARETQNLAAKFKAL